MSSTASTVAARRSEARREAARPQGEQFAVLDAKTLAERARLRRARALGLLAGCVVAGALAIVTIGQDLVTSQQIRLDTAREALAQSVTSEQQLQLQRAELESPTRILQLAENELHMIAPTSVSYLAPVSLGPTLGDDSSGSPTMKTGVPKHHGR